MATGTSVIFYTNPTIRAYLDSRPIIFEIAYWSCQVFVLLIVACLVYLVIARVLLNYHKRENANTKAAWDPVFRALRKGERLPLPRIATRQRPYVLELWLEQHSIANAGYLEQLDKLAKTIRLDTIICEILKPSALDMLAEHIWQQSLAITATHWVNTPETLTYVAQAAESNNRLLAVNACACLAHLKAPGWERTVIKTLFRFPEEAHAITSRIGAAGGADILHILQPFMSKLPRYTVMNFIALAEESRDPTLVPIVTERLAECQNDEERAALIRTIGHIGNTAQRDLLLPYLETENVNLQVQAAKALGRIGDSSDIATLLPYLSAKDWWLRYRAAEAIVNLSDGDDELIDSLIGSLTDKFAVDMLRHVHSEQEWCLT